MRPNILKHGVVAIECVTLAGGLAKDCLIGAGWAAGDISATALKR